MRDLTVDVAGRKVLEPFMAGMPKVCQPSDIAEAVHFLATATAVNGAEIAVDHGWAAS
jgi:NAD(P)-dependent dehydrogenase (short-subunit alcohol dehydrogenase family)